MSWGQPRANMAGDLRRNREIPASLEGVRRKVMSVVEGVERETDIFLDRYLKNIGDPGKWNSMIKDVCGKVGKESGSLDDFKDLEQPLNKVKSDPEMGKQTTYVQLRRMVERGKMFDYITYSLRNDLVDAYENQLRRYCLSFEAEGEGKDLRTVREYENKVIEWNNDIKQKLQVVDSLLDECDKYKSPLSGYVDAYDKVVNLMEESCKAMSKCCEPMRKWVTSDSVYARRIQEEINQYNKRKMEMRDVIRHLEYQRDQIGLKLRRRAFFALKVERMLHDARDEKRLLKRREATVKENQEKAEAEIQRKKRDLDEVKTKLKNRKENSPSVFNYLTGMIETLREDIWKQESRMDTFEFQRNSLKRQQSEVQKQLDRLSVELDASNRIRDQQMQKLQKQEYDVKFVKDEIKSMDSKVISLKVIREIKLHSDTIKKIYHYGYHPGQIVNYKGKIVVSIATLKSSN